MSTTPWWKIVTPHDDIKQGRVKQNDFAASLADVLSHNGNPDYYDPERFFNRTFLTGGLRQLAGEVIGRLTGQGDGDAVMQIQTPFGGGKTHTLICLYHLVKNGSVCFEHKALRDYRLERGWKVPPTVPVAAFDGNQIGTGALEVSPGISPQTMWGHIAWQLAGKDGYQLVARHDKELVSPGGDDIDKLLKHSGGGLIILDEVVNYIEKTAAVAVQDSTLRAQTLTFLQTLTGRAGAHPRVVIAATLPKSSTEVHGTASADALDRLQKIFGRVQKVREPVEGDEVHEIIRRRLFLEIGKSSERAAALREYIEDLKTRPQIPDEAKEHSYAKRFEQSYPFHPYLIDILERYVASNPKFQRTRGALRLLALIVADLLKQKRPGGLIHASDINLKNEEIRSELLELVDREFRSTLEADITGNGANAAELDRQLSPQLAPWHIATGLATTTFLFTCESGNSSRGATIAELNLASARPEIDKGTIPGVILQIKENFHYINPDGERYRFSTTPNLNRILLDAKNGVDEQRVRDRISSELRKLFTQAPLSAYQWPEEPSDVPDSGTNKLVVLAPERSMGHSSAQDTQKFVLELLNKSGSTHRTRRNTLIFLLADEREVAALKDRVRFLLAVENVDTNQMRYNLSKSQLADLTREKTNATKGARQQLLRTWRHIAWGGSSEEPLKSFDMGQPPVGTEDNLTELAVKFLQGKQKLLEKLAPILIVHPTKLKVWPEDEKTLSLKVLPDYFRNFTHLPLLRGDDVLKQAIAEGVSAGQFALAQGTSESDITQIQYKVTLPNVSLEDGYVLIRPALAEAWLQTQEEKKTPPIGAGGEFDDEPVSRGTVNPPFPPEGGVSVLPPKPPLDSKPRKVSLEVEVPFAQFHQFFSGVINNLGRNADKIKIKVSLEASSSAGFNVTLIEDSVKETLYNIFKKTDDLKVE